MQSTATGLKLSRGYRDFYISHPFVGFFSITVATYLVETGISSTFGGGMSVQYAAEKILSNLMLDLLLETLFITFVLPVAADEAKPAPPEVETAVRPVENSCRTLTISGTNIFVWPTDACILARPLCAD